MRTLLLYAVSAILVLVYFYGKSLDSAFSDSAMLVLRTTAAIAIGLAVARTLEYLIVDIYFYRISARVTSDLLRLIVSLFLYSCCVIGVIGIGLGKDITSLLATSAVLTVVAGFALQPTLGNFFSGVALEVEQPMKVGDFIKMGEIEGRVEQMRWRSVFVRTIDGSTHIVSNAGFMDGSVEVFPAGAPVCCVVEFDVPSWVPPSRVLQITREQLATPLEGKLEIPKPGVVLVDSCSETASLRYEARFYTNDYFARQEQRSSVIEHLWYGLHRDNIPIAAPSVGEYSLDAYLPDPRKYKKKEYERFDAQADSSGDGAFTRSVLNVSAPIVLCNTASRDKRNLGLLDSTALFGALNTDERARVVETMQSFYFGKSEIILMSRLPLNTLSIIANGHIRIDITEDAKFVSLQNRSAESFNISTTWLPSTLDKLTERYTLAVGPIAKAIITDEAQKTDDLFELYQVLAERIPEGDGKQQFLATAPETASLVAAKGTTIGMMSFLLGHPPGNVRKVAITESEIVCIPQSIASRLMYSRPELCEEFARVAISGVNGASAATAFEIRRFSNELADYHRVDLEHPVKRA